MRTDPKIIVRAIHQHEDGFSLSGVRPIIKGRIHYDEKVIHVKGELCYDLNAIDSKTKRHFGSFEGAEDFLNLRRIIKNFVNPHQGLKGKTPAEAAEINLNLGRNKLFDLIKYRAKTQVTKR